MESSLSLCDQYTSCLDKSNKYFLYYGDMKIFFAKFHWNSPNIFIHYIYYLLKNLLIKDVYKKSSKYAFI